MAKPTAIDIADAIIHYCNQHDIPVNQYKLQFLLYYVQAWHLAQYGKPLFEEPFEAWIHGPVQPEVSRAFDKWSSYPITTDAPPKKLTKHVAQHIADVLETHGKFEDYELERYTRHEEPWLKARGDLRPDCPSNAIIDIKDMKTFFRARLNGQKKKD
jgi:uncharacterized phage-associated protein